MKRIHLLRHSKSSWKDPGLADHERPLSGRGRSAAAAMARYFEAHGIEPDLVLCSTATRARQTLEALAPALTESAVQFEGELYGAGARGLLERIRRVPDVVASVLVVGHNPDLEQLALDLVRPDAELLDDLAAKYPTGALATLTFAGARWSDLDHQTADLVGFVKPRDLE